jgi:ubiquinone/menaquinone biosynthesis C-methylase UbiE
MNSTDNTQRFTEKADNYTKYRPTYPEEFIEYLAENSGISENCIVADVGAGTGKLTKQLLEKSATVYAVEPNKNMLKSCIAYCKDLKGLFPIDGSSEHTTLSENSVDLITVAQAFHWFNVDNTKTEFKRILKPHGKVVLVWNKRDVQKEGFSADYEKLMTQYGDDYKINDHKILINDALLQGFFKDGKFETVTFENNTYNSYETFLGRALSSSYSPKPHAQNYNNFINQIETIFNKYNEDDVIRIDYKTVAYIGEI